VTAPTTTGAGAPGTAAPAGGAFLGDVDLAGAGLLSSVQDLDRALATGDAAHVAAAAQSVAVDLVGFAMDPVGELLQGVAGWLIEHLWFLREPLDALAGDPPQIKAQARTWLGAAATLSDLAAEYPRRAAAVTRWDGAAAREYRAAVDDYAFHLDRAAGAARAASGEILDSAATVGTVRALIRDLVAAFVAKAVERAVYAMATAVPTGGASVATCTAVVVLEAVELARENARHVARLLDDLATSAERLAAVDKVIETVRDATIEAGKQAGEARQDTRAWTAAG
jgi:hypothetical protein